MAYREDSYYIERVLQHADSSAFAKLIDKHKTMAFNIALRITRNREDAEEVAQDAFIKLYHSLDQFRGESKFTTWFFRVVYNLGLAKIRRKSLVDRSVDDEDFIEIPDEKAFDALEKFKNREKHQFLSEAIGSLDESEQLIITLYYMNDQRVEDIASITGMSASNVKVKLFRSRKKIQEFLEKTLKDELHTIL